MSNEIFTCEKTDCFGCAAGKCRILTEPVEGKPCPFFATRAEVYDSRAKAYVRLKKLGREDLIEKYSGIEGKKNAEGRQNSNTVYLKTFEKAEPGSYAAKVHAEYVSR